MKKIWILLMLLNSGHLHSADIPQEEEQKVAEEEIVFWTQEMIRKYGKSFRSLIHKLNGQTESYTTEEDESEAEKIYQNLLREYNPQTMNQAHRRLYNDFYKRLEDIKIWRSFLRDLQQLESAPSIERTQYLYECLREKYQTGHPGKSRVERQQILRAERDARLALLTRSPQQRIVVPPPSPIFAPGQDVAPTEPPSPIFGAQRAALENFELESPWGE